MKTAPTLRAVLAAGAVIPISVAITMSSVHLWPIIVALDVVLIGLFAFDILWSSASDGIKLELDSPTTVYVGEKTQVKMRVTAGQSHGRFSGLVQVDGPQHPIEPRELMPSEDRRVAEFELEPTRRGTIEMHEAWVRWTGSEEHTSELQ